MAKRPILRVFLLALLIAAGLAAFFWLAPKTPVIVRPAETESGP